MLPSSVCAALADNDRLRLFGEISRSPAGIPVADLQLDPHGRKALGKLLGAGLVERTSGSYLVRPEVFREALQDQGSPAGADGANDRIAALFSKGKLTAMPRPGALRTELLRYLIQRFDHDQTYTEAQLREAFQPVYGDHAALRRYLVEEELMARDNHGSYWRVV
ncbi:MAG: DUF2087 domain-containing protein [Actinomycetota bacterium]